MNKYRYKDCQDSKVLHVYISISFKLIFRENVTIYVTGFLRLLYYYIHNSLHIFKNFRHP